MALPVSSTSTGLHSTLTLLIKDTPMETTDISQVDDDDDDGFAAQLETHWNTIHGISLERPAPSRHDNENVSPFQPESP